jgi:Lrp/AsnC family transcriptional regulator for asnA, asnC and gidA
LFQTSTPETRGHGCLFHHPTVLEKGSYYTQIVDDLVAIHEITEIHYTTGRYSIFLKIVCKNTKELRHVLNDKIQPIDSVQRTETFISLEESMIRPIKVLQEEVLAKELK